MFSIISIVSCVLGGAYVVGYALGVGEAIAAVMVIGLSVDYVIHLGHMYSVARQEGYTTRLSRFTYAAEMMGTTLVAGAVTTAGSAAVMFICQLNFFATMATLITLTIAASVLYSMLFFLPALAIMGPQHDFAQWTEWCKKP